MQNRNSDILLQTEHYYTSKILRFGNTPQGVDWNSVESQTLRFQQLCKVIDAQNEFSLNDLGCGYGAFVDFLNTNSQKFSYVGIDISEEMIKSARIRYNGCFHARFIHSNVPDQMADFGIASGIFNVRLQQTEIQWEKHILDTLDILNSTSRLGFAFNCLTTYSDADKMKTHLYYADPCFLFDFCKKNYSRNVALLHDYGLFEFTILVRKICE